MQEGETVAITGLAARFAEYETMMWIIKEKPDQESRVLLNAAVHPYLFIRVGGVQGFASDAQYCGAGSRDPDFELPVRSAFSLEDGIVDSLTNDNLPEWYRRARSRALLRQMDSSSR